MTPIAPLFMALVCSIFGTASELTKHDHNSAPDSGIYRTNPKFVYDDKHKLTQISGKIRQHDIKTRRKRETNYDKRCAPFEFREGVPILSHPRNETEGSTYSSNTKCFTTITAGEGKVVVLTFVDKFEMEDPIPRSDPPLCKHDYIEIRDGQFGYAQPVYRFCGKTFPPTITSTGPFMWLKFSSDDTIQYSGFTINVEFQTSVTSRRIPEDCFMSIKKQKSGMIDSIEDAKKCRELTSAGAAMDFQWTIETEAGTQIFLNFTTYQLAKPNQCDANAVQVFGAEPNFDYELGSFCGSVPKSVTTKLANGNIMYVRMYSKDKHKMSMSNITAQFTAFRTLQGDDDCIAAEFNCLDGTCIDGGLSCDETANCRLKADEDPAICKTALRSPENDPQVILIIFCVILSAMISVFLFKCILKVYQDQKAINEHLLKSREGTLDKLSEINRSFDPSRLTRESNPRASLERENQTNEMYKQQRNKEKSSSIESDFLRQSTSPDLNEWPESIPILPEDIKIEHKGRTRRDTSKREELLRTKSSGEEGNENGNLLLEAPDTQESGCQTRDSLFQADPVRSFETNSTNSRGLSTFGFSGATIARPTSLRFSAAPTSPPVNLSGFAIEPIGSHADRRPMSSETTRSAPDVIIVSKPIH